MDIRVRVRVSPGPPSTLPFASFEGNWEQGEGRGKNKKKHPVESPSSQGSLVVVDVAGGPFLSSSGQTAGRRT